MVKKKKKKKKKKPSALRYFVNDWDKPDKACVKKAVGNS